MNKTIMILIAVGIVLAISSYVLMFTNRDLYCQIAMFGNLRDVPAICLQDAVQQIISH